MNPVLDLAASTRSLAGLNSLGTLVHDRDGYSPIRASQYMTPFSPSRSHMAGLGFGDITSPDDTSAPDGNPVLDPGIVVQGIPQDYYQFGPTMQLGIDPPFMVRAGFGELGCEGCGGACGSGQGQGQGQGMGDLSTLFSGLQNAGCVAWAGLGLLAYLIFFGGSRAKARRSALSRTKDEYREAVAEAKLKYPRT